MTPECFVYWLKGYFAQRDINHSISHVQAKLVVEMLDKVHSPDQTKLTMEKMDKVCHNTPYIIKLTDAEAAAISNSINSKFEDAAHEANKRIDSDWPIPSNTPLLG